MSPKDVLKSRPLVLENWALFRCRVAADVFIQVRQGVPLVQCDWCP